MQNHRPHSTSSTRFSAWKRPLAVFFAVLLLTTACDALDVVPGDSISLTTSRVICFEFSNITDGQSKTITSTDILDLDAYLADQGFTKSEVIGAEVTGITMRLRFPSQADFSVIENASLSLRAGSINTTIGNSSNLGTSRTANLNETGSNVGSVIRASSFQGELDLTGAASLQDDFLIEVELDISVEVEGV